MLEILGIALAVYLGIGLLFASIIVLTKSGRDLLQESCPIVIGPPTYALMFVILTFIWVVALKGVKLTTNVNRRED